MQQNDNNKNKNAQGEKGDGKSGGKGGGKSGGKGGRESMLPGGGNSCHARAGESGGNVAGDTSGEAGRETRGERIKGGGGWEMATRDRFDNFAPYPAMQSKRESWREAWQNTALAFVISILAHRYVVMPVLDWWAGAGYDRADWAAAFGVTLFYTALSLGRNYLIRRIHARKAHTRHLRQKQHDGKK